ncbi:hypothetical protein HKD37_06G016326 [Glycine soja]
MYIVPKKNGYRLPLLDFIGVIPTGMTFSVVFAYLEGIFLRRDALPRVIVTDKDLALMNEVKTIFLECTNLLCRFHIDKNVKANYVMDAWGSLVDYPLEEQFDECLKKFEIACSPWPMFVDYVNETWIIPQKENFVTAWTNKVMHVGNTTTNKVESAHWALKRVLQDSLGDLCSVWDAMNNMIMLQHTEIKASFETSTHVVGHASWHGFKIAAEFERVHYASKNPSSCGCVMRTTHSLPCACETSKYVVGSIPLDLTHMFWRRLSFLDQGLSEPQVTIKEEMETISKRFEELDVCVNFMKLHTLIKTLYVLLQKNVNTKGAHKKPMNRNQRSTKCDLSYWSMLMLYILCKIPFIHDFIDNIVDVKADGNCGYRLIVAVLGMGEDSWSLMRKHLLKELGKWSNDYIKLFGGTNRFKELRRSLLVGGLSMVTVDKWMDIIEMGYVIVSRYNVILVSLSQQQSMTFFPLRSQPPTDSSMHHIICIGHVYDNHFVQIYLKDCCPLSPLALLWSRNCHPQAKQ